MTCRHCGAPLNQGQAFCSRCGQAVSETAKQTNDTSVIPEQSAQSPSPAAVKQPISKKKKAILIASSMVALVAVVLGIILFATADSREMKRALKTQSAENVMRVYNRLLRQDKSSVADRVLVDYIVDATDTLNEEFTYTVDPESNSEQIQDSILNFMRSKWGTVFWGDEENDLYDIESPAVEKALDDFYAMERSKVAYYIGESSMLSAEDYEDYRNAMHNYAKVLESDSLYSDSVEKYEQASNAYFDAVVALADSYISQNDYSAALSLLDDELETDDAAASAELQAKLDEIKKNYAAQYAEKAKNCFTSGDVHGAIGNIEAAIAIYPDGAYQASLEEYNLYLPYSLYDNDNILIEKQLNGSCHIRDSVTANNGTVYQNVLSFYCDDSDVSELYSLTYQLSGKYDTVSGTVLLAQYDKSDTGVGYFEAYGDGKLLYTSPKVTAGVLPSDVKFDVSGVQTLEIRVYGSTSDFWGKDIGIANLVAKKDIPNNNAS